MQQGIGSQRAHPVIGQATRRGGATGSRVFVHRAAGSRAALGRAVATAALLGLSLVAACGRDAPGVTAPVSSAPTLQGAVVPYAQGGGIWITRSVLMTRPTSGTIWDDLLKQAAADPGTPDIAYQDSQNDVYTLAEALVCARVGQYCAKAIGNVVGAIGTEQGGRWLAVGRNLTSYVISADLLNLRADGNPTSAGTRVQNWIQGFLTEKLADNNTGVLVPFPYFDSGSNASAQQGMAYAAVAAYLDDTTALNNVWNAFRRYACDPSAPDPSAINLSAGVKYNWAYDNTHPCAVNPAGTSKMVPAGYPGAGTVHRIDGSIINDMRRGGYYQWTPGYTSYPWVGMEGFVPAATILYRAGFTSAFSIANNAVLRAADYLWWLRNATGYTPWFDGSRSAEIVQLVDVVYGATYPHKTPVSKGRTVGFTDWTHSSWPN